MHSILPVCFPRCGHAGSFSVEIGWVCFLARPKMVVWICLCEWYSVMTKMQRYAMAENETWFFHGNSLLKCRNRQLQKGQTFRDLTWRPRNLPSNIAILSFQFLVTLPKCFVVTVHPSQRQFATLTWSQPMRLRCFCGPTHDVCLFWLFVAFDLQPCRISSPKVKRKSLICFLQATESKPISPLQNKRFSKQVSLKCSHDREAWNLYSSRLRCIVKEKMYL